MATINRFEELEVWKLAREFTKTVYKITSRECFKQDYRFCAQMRAAAGSIMDNIAEGFERNGKKEFVQFLSIAKGSCGECRSQLYRALDICYIDKELFENCFQQTEIISKLLSNLIKYLQASELKGTKYK